MGLIRQYQCVQCERTLEAERTVEVVPFPPNTVQVRYVCECSDAPLVGRYKFISSNLAALVGTPLQLPWRSPTTPRVVPDDHPALVQWRWELDQQQDSKEFLSWLALIPFNPPSP